MDFFDAKYIKESPRNETLFGLVDDGQLACSTTKNASSWIAVVKNRQGKKVQFNSTTNTSLDCCSKIILM